MAMQQESSQCRRNPLRRRIHEVIFEADTHAGKVFDAILLLAITLTVITVMLDSVEEIGQRYSSTLHIIEWTLTLLFTVEYALRLWSVRHPWHYAKSFFGVIDLLAIIPTYLSLIFVGSQSLMVIRLSACSGFSVFLKWRATSVR